MNTSTNHFNTKLIVVFVPSILLALSFILCYLLLYLALYIWLKIVPLKEEILQLWIPMIFGGIAVYIFIRPRVHLLKLDKDNGRVRTLYYLVATALLAVPIIIGTIFLDTSTGKLTELNDITEINQKPSTKYYTVNNHKVYEAGAGIESAIRMSGKHNNTTNFDIYISVPLIKTWDDTLNSPAAFLSYHYHESYSHRLSAAERKDRWAEFWTMSLYQFHNLSKHFIYLDRMPNNDKRDYFFTAARRSSLYSYQSPILILKPIDDDFKNRNGNKLFHAVLSFSIAAFVWFVMIIIPGLHEDKAKKFRPNNKEYLESTLKSMYNSFKAVKGFMATPVLVMVNTLVFTIMVFAGFGFWEFKTIDLLEAGAIFKPYIENGEWWRLISAMFIHGSLIHLFMNMIGLYLCGIIFERNIGTVKFALAYFASGIGAGVVSIEWHDTPIVTVGASGAIFGLYGVFLALVLLKKFEPGARKFMLIFLGITAGYSLLVGFLSEGIDNAAHIGGLITGFLIGSYFAMTYKKEKAESKYLK